MAQNQYPGRYLDLNQSSTKNLNLVIQIAGVPGLFAVVPIYEKVRYGDPRLKYGMAGLKYGGLIKVDNVRSWIMWDSGITISQKIEPEQGRGAVSTMTLKFIDKDGYMSQLISPGIILDEPLGNKLCTISMGYTNSAFPDDYFRVFRGFISSTKSGAGWVELEFSDANIRSRQEICVGGSSSLTADVGKIPTVLPIGSSAGYFQPIVDLSGNYDWQLNDILVIGNTTLGSQTITGIASTAGIAHGDSIAGPGIPVLSTVSGITPTTIVMTVPATANGIGVPIDFVGSPNTTKTVRTWVSADGEFMEYGPNGLMPAASFTGTISSTINPTVITNVSSVLNLKVGGTLSGLGIPANTVITAFDPMLMTVTMSNPAALTLPDITINVTPELLIFRGTQYSRGTDRQDHAMLTQALNGIQIQGNPIDLILKVYLSGWGGPWLTGVSCVALGTILIPGVYAPNAVLFNVDVVEEYGFVPGDQITISGSVAGNDGSYIVTDIQDWTGDSNRIVILDHAMTLENPASSVSLAFRSQYDTLPINCGLANTPQDVDIRGFLNARDTFFSTGQFTLQLFIQDSISGKSYLEKEIFLPIGAYSITRMGRLSIAMTAPPLVGTKLVQLDNTNILNPKNIVVQRSLNNRRFYNLVQYSFDSDDSGNFASVVNLFDAATLMKIYTMLPIPSLGLRTSLGGALVIAARGLSLLNRFKGAATEITLDCNWAAGSIIEVGDVVILKDPGTLQITDYETGKRGLGTKLYEVISRTLKPQTGKCTLTLLSSLGYSVGQRYATISPSSYVDAGSTTATIIIKDSFGPLYPGNEKKKWENILGTQIVIHDAARTYSHTAILAGFDPANAYKMILKSAIAYTPVAGDIVDVDSYGTGTDPTFNEVAKTFFTFIDPTLTAVTGIDQTHFTVSPGDAAKLALGQPVIVHNAGYTLQSPEVNVKTIAGTTIEVTKALGFVPSAGQKIEGVGFMDGGNPYRSL
jgi:hypothetical protein